MVYKNILLIIILVLINQIYSQENIDYLIFTTSTYQNAAEIIAKLHEEDVETTHRLNTEIVYLDNFSWYDINNTTLKDSIRQEVLNYLNINEIKYLLLLGDEVTIPPIYILIDEDDAQPSDDFYSCEEDITTYDNLSNFIPRISTGRIPVNDPEIAVIIAEKLYKYMVEPTLGYWRSKVGLIADDENKNGYSRNELNHTINSDNIYQNISNNLTVSQFYGVNYESIENGAYITKPQMTSDVLNYINQGVALINYIGHGSETTLGGEKIIEMDRDFGHICSLGTMCQEENMPAIWVVGTCSFGKYDDNEEIMSEKLLFNEFGAISLVTTSRGIGAYSNSFYLSNLFNRIDDFVSNLDNNDRLGDIVRKAKQLGKNTEYLFHLLGDPALILPFPKVNSDLINENMLIENGLVIMDNI